MYHLDKKKQKKHVQIQDVFCAIELAAPGAAARSARASLCSLLSLMAALFTNPSTGLYIQICSRY